MQAVDIVNKETNPPAHPPRQGADSRQTGIVESHDLLGPGGRLEIRHRGEIYRLSITRQGKLILTK